MVPDSASMLSSTASCGGGSGCCGGGGGCCGGLRINCALIKQLSINSITRSSCSSVSASSTKLWTISTCSVTSPNLCLAICLKFSSSSIYTQNQTTNIQSFKSNHYLFFSFFKKKKPLSFQSTKLLIYIISSGKSKLETRRQGRNHTLSESRRFFLEQIFALL